MSKPTTDPKTQPCETCLHFRWKTDGNTTGFCSALQDGVNGQWRGCVRWRPKLDQPKVATMMDTQEINIAIAKALGWSGIKPSGRLDGQMVGYPAKNPIVGKPQEIPDYCRDLNATHEMEKTLVWETCERACYKEFLERTVARDERDKQSLECTGAYMATARQRAEAFLNVKNL